MTSSTPYTALRLANEKLATVNAAVSKMREQYEAIEARRSEVALAAFSDSRRQKELDELHRELDSLQRRLADGDLALQAARKAVSECELECERRDAEDILAELREKVEARQTQLHAMLHDLRDASVAMIEFVQAGREMQVKAYERHPDLGDRIRSHVNEDESLLAETVLSTLPHTITGWFMHASGQLGAAFIQDRERNFLTMLGGSAADAS